MNFTTANKVSEVISQMKLVEVPRSRNRALIDNLFNGLPPYTAQEEKENNIYVNVNWKEGTNALHAARGQYENAFLKPGNFFKVTLDDAPIDKQAEWSRVVTQEINRSLKESRPYIHTQRSKFAGVVLHGVGCQMWEDDETPIPFFVPMSDILIPTDTDITMENLQFFAVRRKMKPGQLFLKTIGAGANMDRGWNLKLVKKMLDNLKDVNVTAQGGLNWTDHPEQMAELYKQNTAYYDSDKAPTIWLWDFYYHETTAAEVSKRGWYRKIIQDEDCTDGRASDDANSIQFVYESRKPSADNLDEFIHFQFGDGNNVPPFKYHSIRSLGWLLFDVVQLMNRLRCQFTQHVFESMLTLFRVTNPADRARISSIVLMDKGIIPDGASIVPASERFNINAQLISGLMSNLKQLINESSSSYTQALDSGTQKERTKYEVEAIMSQISSLMSSLLNLAYIQEYFAYIEICKRFTKKDSDNFMVKKFFDACKIRGVDPKFLNSSRWTIAVEQVIGSGNKMLEIAQARELRGMRPTLDPEAQREVDRIYISALTDNAKLADFLVPEGQQVTDAIHDAELSFGSLMQGAPMSIKEGLNHHEQVATLLRLMGQTIKRIQDSGGMATAQEVSGLQNVAQYIQQHIQIIAQDVEEKAKVKEYADMLGNFENFVRAFAQRLQEQQQQSQAQNADPAALAKIHAMMAMEALKLRTKDAQAQQKIQHKDAEFVSNQQRKDAESQAEIQRKAGTSVADVAIKGMTAGATPKTKPYSE